MLNIRVFFILMLLMDQTWENVYEAETSHKKAELFQKNLLDQFENNFPEKIRKISSDDSPWITQKIEENR